MKITAQDLLELNVIDGVIKEAKGGAHNDKEETATNIKEVLSKALKELEEMTPEELRENRYQKFRKIGVQ